MKPFYLVYHLARADFLERVRRYGFLVALFATVGFTYLCLPAVDSIAWLYLNLGNGRPLYNSAWIGLAVTKLMGEFFPLFGFYLVKNTLERDRRTGVGEIIATTPVTRAVYMMGKWLSNTAVFGVVILVTLFTSLILQFVRAEEFTVDLWALVAPFLLLLLPELAFIAALAVLFEAINWLRGGFGNLFYYLVYMCAVLVGLQGIGSVWSSISAACAAQLDGCKTGGQIDIGSLPLARLAVFRYNGVNWTPDIIVPRLSWLVLAAAVALLAAFFFHRFDPSRVGKTPWALIRGLIMGFVMEPRRDDPPALNGRNGTALMGPKVAVSSAAPVALATHAKRATRSKLNVQLLQAELHLTLRGLHWMWYLGAAAIIAGSLLVSLDIARLVILPLAMVWPVLVWSSLGVREVHYRTAPIVFALPHPLSRQLLATWLTGALVALAMASTVIARLALAGEWAACAAGLVGALFVPSLAVALGCWSGTGKLFQATYLFVWYLASVQVVVFVDYMGHLPQAVELGVPWVVAAATMLLLIAAAFGRRHRVLA